MKLLGVLCKALFVVIIIRICGPQQHQQLFGEAKSATKHNPVRRSLRFFCRGYSEAEKGS